MRNLLNSKWLFFINTLPIAVLLFFLFGQFNIIKTLLSEDNIRLWGIFGLTLGILGLLNFVYAVYLTVKKLTVSLFYGIIALLCYTAFLYLYGFYFREIVPFDIPEWMMSGNVFLYAGTFLMPTLAYSLFILVVHLTHETKEHRTWLNFLIVIAIPVTAFIFSRTGLPFMRIGSMGFRHAMLVLTIIITMVFLFFLIRAIFIVVRKKAAVWRKYQLAWKIPVSILLPLLGLLINNGVWLDYFSGNDSGIFGNFNSFWFYGIAVLNGILICLPGLENKIYRLFLFAGRSITFAYTVYFFLVFLPFLPFSLVAIIAFGAGFLMLTPLLLFGIYVNELVKDYKRLILSLPKKLVIGVLLSGFLVIPVIITAAYLKDRSVLNKTLAYLYSPDYSDLSGKRGYGIDRNSLKRTLNVIKNHTDKDNRVGLFGSQQPYLSSYFNWLVLDNLTLSDSKIKYIERVFFGSSPATIVSENIQNKDVKITGISTDCEYDKAQNAWKSWVDLEITSKNDSRFAEYAANFDLPEGCWISGYYLYVGDKKEYGILSEKKSALWVFANIRNENRDPGILYYLTGKTIALRVFPFTKNEVRKTGIEFLHKEPVTLVIDSNVIKLGNDGESVFENIETENAVYVSAKQKQTLTQVKRRPYFHFLVDVSEGKEEFFPDFKQRIETALNNKLNNYQELSQNAQISFVNSYVKTYPLDKNIMQTHSPDFKGGFFLERAIKTALFNAYKNGSYPVIVVVTDDILSSILDEDFSDFEFAFPESDLFFNLDGDGTLHAHSLTRNPSQEISPVIIVATYEEFMEKITSAMFHHTFDQSVLEYRLLDNSTAYLRDNGMPSVFLKKDVFKINVKEVKEKDWQSALEMRANWMSQILHPETSDNEWLNLFKCSLVSQVMTPVTSYLVVENEAQKAALKKKQEQVLSSNKSLDTSEDAQRMSEPGLWLLAILFGLILVYKQRRWRRKDD